MHHRCFTGGLTALCALFAVAIGPAGAADPRVVVELFTSQGCSSCPAADKLLGELAKDPAILPISLSVDYWDYLGWKDTLALPSHGKRQRAYAGARGDRAVYTPQVVINGTTHVLGSDRAAIERAVKHARTTGPHAPAVPVTLAVADGKLTVDVAAARQQGQAGEVWLCPLVSKVPVQIGRGENRGQTVTYTNVVRGWVKLGDWNGNAQQFVKALSDIKSHGDRSHADVDAVAVLVQGGVNGSPGQVFGGATTSLR